MHVKNFNQLKDDHNDLHGRHLEHGNKLEQAEQVLGGTDRAFQKFLKDHRHQCEEDTQILSNITKHLNELSALVDDTRESVHKQGLDIQTAVADIQLLTGALDQDNFDFRVSQLERQHDGMAGNLQRTIDMLNKTEDTVTRLGDEFVNSKITVQSILQDLGIKTADNINTISELSKVLQRQGDVLADTAQKTDRASRDQKRLYEQQNAAEQEIDGIKGVNKMTTEKLDAHAHEQSRTRSDLASLNNEADARLSRLRGDLGATGATLTKLSSRFKACNHNIQGVGKGLQDVHNHTLMGEHNLITPKSARTVTPVRRKRTPSTGTQRLDSR